MVNVVKNCYGDWCSDTQVPIDNGRVLRITTMKRFDKSLTTTASAGAIEGGFFTHTVFQDFSKRVSVTRPGRITSGAVMAQHAAVIANIESIKTEANQHYVQKGLALPA